MRRITPHLLATPALCCLLLLSACGQSTAVAPPSAATAIPAMTVPDPQTPQADLSGIKSYLLETSTELKGNTAALKQAADRYYTLSEQTGFRYDELWRSKPAEVSKALAEAKAAWIAASPAYERMEGIVAGVPSLAEYDVILDAGAAASEDPESAVPFDLKLPDGRVLPQPGNLFGLLEGTLWGTRPEFVAPGVEADLDGNGKLDFGEALPDAAMLKAAADELDRYSGELLAAGQKWQPNESDAFTALIVMIPTMSEYFESWKQSRFVQGDATTQNEFVVISRLADVQDILSGLEVVYQGVSPLILTVNPAQDRQTSTGLQDLQNFVADIHSREQGGKIFSPEEADTLGSEAQERAAALAGQISQVAAQLKITVAE